MEGNINAYIDPRLNAFLDSGKILAGHHLVDDLWKSATRGVRLNLKFRSGE